MNFLAEENNPGLQVFWSVKYTMVMSYMYPMALVGIEYYYPLFLRLIKCIYIDFKLFDRKNARHFVQISQNFIFSGPDFIPKSTILHKLLFFLLKHAIVHVLANFDEIWLIFKEEMIEKRNF